MEESSWDAVLSSKKVVTAILLVVTKVEIQAGQGRRKIQSAEVAAVRERWWYEFGQGTFPERDFLASSIEGEYKDAILSSSNATRL